MISDQSLLLSTIVLNDKIDVEWLFTESLNVFA